MKARLWSYIILSLALACAVGSAGAQEPDAQKKLDSMRTLASLEAMPILDQYKGSPFSETRRLQSFASRALFACQMGEKILAVSKQTYLLRRDEAALNRSIEIFKDGEVCVRRAQEIASGHYDKSLAEIQKKRKSAVDKLKAYHAAWLSIMRGMPRDLDGGLRAADDQHRKDSQFITSKEVELDIELQ